jgi:hypothetical protein
LLVLAQVCCALIFNAVAVVSSFNAVSDINGRNLIFGQGGGASRQGVPYLMVRIGELRSHQLIEATVRAYCIRHERHAIDDTTAITSASSSSSSETPRTVIERRTL